MALEGIPKIFSPSPPLYLTFSPGSNYAASVSGHVTSHLIATACGSVLYAVVAYYTMEAGTHTGLQLQKWLHTEEHVYNGTTAGRERVSPFHANDIF